MPSEKEILPRLAKTVPATAQIAGTDIKTVYSFGGDTYVIEVFVSGELKVKIVESEKHVMYYNDMKHDDLPPAEDICASTVIAANNCVINTEITRRGKRQSIAVYKNEQLLCRNGSTILEE